MKNFALIGAAGYIAPRHMKAIKETGNNLLAALDPSDSVGIIDRYFPKASFFTEFERFDRFLEKKKREGQKVDYVVVCSPNYLHDAHIRFGLRYGADVICEKPIVLNPWNIDALQAMENEFQHKVYSILQLRMHPEIIKLKDKVDNSDAEPYDITLTYQTRRGLWYYASWKGNIEKSGGVATNIGIHFFDILLWIFGDVEENIVHLHTHDRAAGILKLKKARVRWFLSINEESLPDPVIKNGNNSNRELTINGEKINFTDGFEDLHTISYDRILDGEGYGLREAKKSIELVHEIRNIKLSEVGGDYHPLCDMPLSQHPFKK